MPAALASLLLDAPGAKKQWKNTVFRNFPNIFAHLTLSSFFYSSLFCFPSLHIVGSLTVNLPSNMYTDSYIKCLAREAKCIGRVWNESVLFRLAQTDSLFLTIFERQQ